jgi:hypothetical protein
MDEIEKAVALLQSAGWRIQPPLTQENCQHPHKYGSGSISSDGSGYSEWSCPACGKRERTDYKRTSGGLVTVDLYSLSSDNIASIEPYDKDVHGELK